MIGSEKRSSVMIMVPCVRGSLMLSSLARTSHIYVRSESGPKSRSVSATFDSTSDSVTSSTCTFTLSFVVGFHAMGFVHENTVIPTYENPPAGQNVQNDMEDISKDVEPYTYIFSPQNM